MTSVARWARIRRDVAVLVARVGGAAVQMLAVVVVGQARGPEVLGYYLVFQSATRVAGTVLSFGDPWYVLRSVAEHDAQGRPDRSGGVLHDSLARQSRLIAGASAVVGAVFAAGVAVGWFPWSWGWSVLAAVVAGAAFAYTAIIVNGLKARERQSSGLLLEFALPPLAVVLWVLVGPDGSDRSAMGGLFWVYTAAAVLSGAVGLQLWRRTQVLAERRPVEGPHAAAAPAPVASPSAEPVDPFPEETAADHRRSRTSFGFTNVVQVAGQNLPLLLLPLVLAAGEVGRMGAALRLTAIPGTIGLGLGSVYGPQFARHWIRGDRDGLRRSLRVTQVWMVGLFAPFAVAFIVVPEVLVAVLGDDFEGTAVVLRILGLGQLANALSGQAPMLLSMCRDEAFAMVTAAVTVGLGLVALVVGGAWWGLTGAAVAHATMITVRNVVVWARAVQFVIPNLPGPRPAPAGRPSS